MENSRPFRSRRPISLVTVWRTRRRATTPSAWGLAVANFWLPPGARARVSSRNNRPNAAAGRRGFFWERKVEPPREPQLAQAGLGGKGDFIFDVQGHFVAPPGAWVKTPPADSFTWSPKA